MVAGVSGTMMRCRCVASLLSRRIQRSLHRLVFKPWTRNPKPETRNPKPETRNVQLMVSHHTGTTFHSYGNVKCGAVAFFCNTICEI